MIKRCLLTSCLVLTTLSAYAESYYTSQPAVQSFISDMVTKYHFNRNELLRIFNAAKVRPTVIQSIKAPLEQKPWYTYQKLFITEWRIREGVKYWQQHETILKRAEKVYGVPASIIVATIGVETKYGRNIGEYPVIDALVNIAFGDTPRAPYFRQELVNFLLLTREQHLDPLKVMGSYAGAIGQPQFMPSSYREYAVNFSGSGKIDLSHSDADVIGSIANYYQKHGWKTNQPVAVPASLEGGKYQIHLSNTRTLSKSELLEAGLIPANFRTKDFKVIPLQGSYGNEYWLGFHNFDVIKRYNSSNLYAMTVYQLSYYIKTLREKTNNGAWT